ncbi:MAG: hypothetical protein JKX83_00540 [Pseudomonadales bacterium]|nr:hypothetical protein [Pseudomonadales bacterium]
MIAEGNQVALEASSYGEHASGKTYSNAVSFFDYHQRQPTSGRERAHEYSPSLPTDYTESLTALHQ